MSIHSLEVSFLGVTALCVFIVLFHIYSQIELILVSFEFKFKHGIIKMETYILRFNLMGSVSFYFSNFVTMLPNEWNKFNKVVIS
jgi:hypothetical protein